MDFREKTKVILLGKTGVGKSAIANALTGGDAFKSTLSSRSITRTVQKKDAKIGDDELEVYDTPGLFGTEEKEDDIKQKLQELVENCKSSNSIFLLVLRPDRFTDEDRETVKFIESILGNDIQKTWIIFSHGDKLEQKGLQIQDLIEGSPHLNTLVDTFGNRIHVFNIKSQKKTKDQVERLVSKFKTWTTGLASKIPKSTGCLGSAKPTTERRILLLGKTGVGKSATGNTILGAEKFESKRSLSSVTQKCQVRDVHFEDKTLFVTDCPGFFDTELSDENFAVEMGKSVFLNGKGPHAFVYIVPLHTRFTEQEKLVMEKVKIMYGENVLKHTVIVFTHGDKYKKKDIPIMIERNRFLRQVLKECNDRYVIFNNSDKQNRAQVRNLMTIIDQMVGQNEEYYSEEMFKEAGKFQEEETTHEILVDLIEKLDNASDEDKECIIQKIKDIKQEHKDSERRAREKIRSEFNKLDSFQEAQGHPIMTCRDLGNQGDPKVQGGDPQDQAEPGIHNVQESEIQPLADNSDPDTQRDTQVHGENQAESRAETTLNESNTLDEQKWDKRGMNGFWRFLEKFCRSFCALVLRLRSCFPSCSPNVVNPIRA